MKPRIIICRLCNKEEAHLYCASDSAFLCQKCDVTVHNANFLVARHIRHILCYNCNNLSATQISGSGSLAPLKETSCRNCSPVDDEDDIDRLSSSSLSSACVSTTDSVANKLPPPTGTATSSGSATNNFESEMLGCNATNNLESVTYKMNSDFESKTLGYYTTIRKDAAAGCYNKDNFKSKPLVCYTTIRKDIAGCYNKDNFKSETLRCYTTTRTRTIDVVRCDDKDNFKSETLRCYKNDYCNGIEEVGGGKKREMNKKRRENPSPVRCTAEELFENWSRKIGVDGNGVLLMAVPALEKLMTVVPYRVAAATSFWFGLRNCEGGNGEGKSRTAENLRRLEEMTKVPRKVICAAEEKLTHVLRSKRVMCELEEGWDEC